MGLLEVLAANGEGWSWGFLRDGLLARWSFALVTSPTSSSLLSSLPAMTDRQPKLHSMYVPSGRPILPILTLTSRYRACSNFKIPLAVPSHASIVRRALQVDKERHPHEVQVTMEDLPSGLSMYVSPPFLLSPC